MHESLWELLRCVQLRAAGDFGKQGAVSLLQQTHHARWPEKVPLKLELCFVVVLASPRCSEKTMLEYRSTFIG
ncbi:hypothetical protein KSP39_PZI024126 [Platanthera zijinensis]|uniref:Uncharacterized protein n=1 Tax=Platanthera zijinensis TaxID=2320716 RepID=A0AAP0ASG2_9ASPA